MRNPLDAASPPLHRREYLDARLARDHEGLHDEIVDHAPPVNAEHVLYAPVHPLRSTQTSRPHPVRVAHGNALRRRSLLIRVSALIALATGTLLGTAAHAQVTESDNPVQPVRFMSTIAGDRAAAASAPIILNLLHERLAASAGATQETAPSNASHENGRSGQPHAAASASTSIR